MESEGELRAAGVGTAHQVVGGAGEGQLWRVGKNTEARPGGWRGRQGCWMTLLYIFIFDFSMQGSYSLKRQQTLTGKGGGGKPGR